jgi:hypothetical protein
LQHYGGLLISAKSLGSTGTRNEVRFDHDGYRNLIREEQSHFATWAPRTVQYLWGPAGNGNGRRLEQIVYPSGRKIGYLYGNESAADAAHLINRMTGVGEADANGTITRRYADYTYTGGGRKIAQTWGDPGYQPVVSNFAPHGSFLSGLDRFGRMTRLTFEYPGAGLYPDDILH